VKTTTHFVVLVDRSHGRRANRSRSLLRMDGSPQRFDSAGEALSYVETMDHSRIATPLYPNGHMARVLNGTDRLWVVRGDNIPSLGWPGYDPAGSPSCDPNRWRRCRRVCGRDVPGSWALAT